MTPTVTPSPRALRPRGRRLHWGGGFISSVCRWTEGPGQPDTQTEARAARRDQHGRSSRKPWAQDSSLRSSNRPYFARCSRWLEIPPAAARNYCCDCHRPRTVAFCGASAGGSHSGDCAPQRDRKRCNRGKPHGSGRCLHNTPFLLPPERRSPPPCWEQGGGTGRVPGTGAAAEPGCAWGIGSAWGSSGAGSGGRPAAGMPTASFPAAPRTWLRLRGKGGDEGASVTGVGSQPEPPPFATERPVSPPSSRRLRQGSLAARPDTKQRGLHVVRRHPKPWAAKNSFERSQTENFNLFKATFESLSADYEHVDQTQSPGLDCGGEPRSQIVTPTLKKRSRPRNSSLSKATAAARQAPARLTARGLRAFPQGAVAPG